MRYAITDDIWAVIGPMVDRCKSRPGPALDLPDRMSLEAVLYRARTGVPRRDLPVPRLKRC
jgi:putative transposase